MMIIFPCMLMYWLMCILLTNTDYWVNVCQWRVMVETRQMVEENRLAAAMQSKYLDQPQEVIMRKFSCSLPVLTSLTLRVSGAGSVSGHRVLLSLKDQKAALLWSTSTQSIKGGGDMRDVCWWWFVVHIHTRGVGLQVSRYLSAKLSMSQSSTLTLSDPRSCRVLMRGTWADLMKVDCTNAAAMKGHVR